MATVGQPLTQPESGWRRIEETDSNFTYEGVWGSRSNSAYSGGSQKTQSNTVLNNKIKFKFYGTKIRIISTLYPSYTPKVKIIIDGIEEYYSLQGTQTNMALAYEKTNLPLGIHYIEVEKISNGGYDPDFLWDAIDIDYNGYIANKDFSIRSLAFKEQTTNEHYSLVDNTLIHLPDNSPKNMILHGIEQGKEIQLDVPFDKHRYFNDTPINGASGKVFTHDIGIINTLSIKEIRENKVFEPIYIWYETNMTANNAPFPLVASASSINGTLYEPFKAFDGITTDGATYNTWASASAQHLESWLKIDFGAEKKVNCVALTSRRIENIDQMPKSFAIEGSNDNTQWTELGSFSKSDWQAITTYIFTLQSGNYRYYKIVNHTTNGSNVASWCDIKYGYKREVN